MDATYLVTSPNEFFIQSDFSGGMNLFLDDTKIAANEYREAFNVRNRDGGLKPVTRPVELSTAPAGLKQGIYGFDTFFVLFVAGKAYYQVTGGNTWVNIRDFQMSATAPVIYAVAVPASTLNFKRKLISVSSISGSSVTPSVNLQNTSINGTQAGLVCQDGISQPWIIFPDKHARVTQTYIQWTQDAREYVPVGKQMAFINSILFTVSPDGTKLLRSVTGRPIDFVVNVDINGDKGGDAYTTAYSVSFNEITNLTPMNSGQLFAGTGLGCFPITFDFDNLIFDEPKFRNTESIATGITNQFSFLEILGDYAFIDFNGMRSFNAVKQLNNEGANSIFSQKIASMFEGITQDKAKTCAIVFNNFALFSVRTIFGYGILVFDTITQVWVSFDPTPAPVIQFAVTNSQTNPRLFGITTSKVYEFYSREADSGQTFLRVKSFTVPDIKQELTLNKVRTIFSGGVNEATAIITEYVDEKKGEQVKQPLKSTQGGITYPVIFPVYFDGAIKTNNIVFNFEGVAKTGHKLGLFITWNNLATLTEFKIEATKSTAETPITQQDSNYAS